MCTGKSKNQVHVKMYLFRIFNLDYWQKILESLNMLHKLVQIHGACTIRYVDSKVIAQICCDIRVPFWFTNGFELACTNLFSIWCIYIGYNIGQLDLINNLFSHLANIIGVHVFGLSKGKCCQYIAGVLTVFHWRFMSKHGWSKIIPKFPSEFGVFPPLAGADFFYEMKNNV